MHECTACVSELNQPALRRDGDDYVRVLTVNTVGSFRMTKNFLPLLRCALWLASHRRFCMYRMMRALAAAL